MPIASDVPAGKRAIKCFIIFRKLKIKKKKKQSLVAWNFGCDEVESKEADVIKLDCHFATSQSFKSGDISNALAKSLLQLRVLSDSATVSETPGDKPGGASSSSKTLPVLADG